MRDTVDKHYIYTYTHNLWAVNKTACSLYGECSVCVLCMGVNEIISASKHWQGFLYNPRNFPRVSLPISLTCKAGIEVERKDRRKRVENQ